MTDPVRKAYADTGFGQVHLRRVEGPGDPIVLLHRTPASSACFEAMLRLMAGKRAAVAFDTPGFGASFRPEGSPSAADYARFLLAALDALGIDRFHLCPHHTGTHFAAEMARLAPERVRSLLLNGVLWLDAEFRTKFRTEIGQSRRVDFDGDYLTETWTTMRKLFPVYDSELVHSETLGALAAMDGRDQAFDAVFAQDFPSVLAEVTCPVAVVQAYDDELAPMLHRLRGCYPAMPITRIGPAGMAAPEHQPHAYAEAALAFAAQSEQPRQDPPMTDRRFELVRNPAGFELCETAVPRPEPGPDEVLVRIRAVSLNRRDISIRDLSYPVGDADRFTPLSDGAGEVVAVGDAVTRWKVGDRVVSRFFQDWVAGRVTLPAILSALGAGGQGVFADHVLFAEHGLAAVPDGWSFEEAACLPCAGVTAWSALHTLGKLQKGDWVLIIGTGGVAIFALQIAVAAGAKVVMLSSSDDKLARCHDMGAAATINYATTPDWAAAVKKASDGGVQHAVELGGVGTLDKSLASMGVGGHVALIGALAGFGGDVPGLAMIMSALRVSAVVVGSHAEQSALIDCMDEHDLRPVIDGVFTVGDAEAAYARAAAGVFGKVVIRMGE